MIVTRVIVYEGPDEWVKKTLERTLPDGETQMHQDRETGEMGVVRVFTVTENLCKTLLIIQQDLKKWNETGFIRMGELRAAEIALAFAIRNLHLLSPGAGDTNNDTKAPSDVAKCGAPGGI